MTSTKACGHPVEQPDSVCEDCKQPMCVECMHDWQMCSRCCGELCPTCAVKSVSRTVDNGTRREYLCSYCNSKQTMAKEVLADAITREMRCSSWDGLYHHGSLRFLQSDWLEQVIADLERAIEEAKDAL